MNLFEYSCSNNTIHEDGSLMEIVSVDPNPYTFALSQTSSSRVCDRCILKKVKCDLKRPTCSRCIETGWPCVYSSVKRKPGPARGSRRKVVNCTKPSPTAGISAYSLTSSRNPSDAGDSPLFQQEGLLPGPDIMQPDGSNACALPPASTLWASFPIVPYGILASDTSAPFARQLEANQEMELLNNFFTHIHPSIQLFRKEKFLQRYESGTLSRDVLLTVFVLSAKILGPPKSWSHSSLEQVVTNLLAAKVIDKETPTKRLSLDNFHQACLLAFYTFHQYPGDEAWTRIGQLTRKAYQCGLHQIDNHDQFSAFKHWSTSEDELEEWRYVWWFIYCLDSYSNITAGTPFVVENDSMKTALVTGSLAGSSDILSEPTSAIYLPIETCLLWKTIKDTINSGCDFSFNMHIITTTILRKAATVHRLEMQNPSPQLQTRLVALRNDLSAVRLALPARYLNPGRNALVDESGSEHHARLISVLHLHAAAILLHLPLGREMSDAEWLNDWQHTFGYCQDITSIVKQWDGQYFPSVDPAACFVILGALLFLHLHGCLDPSPDLQMRITTYKDVLLLFLEQFASVWSLPKFLITSFNKFSQLVSGPISQDDISRILRQLDGLLHQKWLDFLSLTSEFEKLKIPKVIHQGFSSQEWDFNSWEQ